MFCSIADIEARVGAGVEITEAAPLVEDAQALIEGYIGKSYGETTPPRTVQIVAATMVARALTANTGDLPTGLTSVSGGAGPFSSSYSFDSDRVNGLVWLSRQDKIKLAPFKTRRFYSVKLV